MEQLSGVVAALSAEASQLQPDREQPVILLHTPDRSERRKVVLPRIIGGKFIRYLLRDWMVKMAYKNGKKLRNFIV